jgi:UMF1 family MFS transporter
MGYMGGGLLFALNVWMLNAPERFGMGDPLGAARFSFVAVGIWWGLFTIPLMAFVREPRPSARYDRVTAREAFARLAATFGEIRRIRTIVLFLAAYWLYIDAVDTIIVMAVDYGLSLGFDRKDLVLALLVVQFVGFPCALAFGRLGELAGTKRAILLALCVYLAAPIWGAFIRSRVEFYVMAALIGSVQGGVQALSRSLYARLIPAGKAAEFFGFYNMVGKFAAILGPALVAGTVLLARTMGAGPGDRLPAEHSLIALLIIAGGVVLLALDDAPASAERALLER